MPTNKHAVIRYQTLDKCFRNPGRKYFIDDLIEACSNAINEIAGISNGVSRRQILEDIKFMESTQGWNIPLERVREGHRIHYRYEDKTFSINNQPLNEEEENQIKEALFTLTRFKGLPQFEWMEELYARLDSNFSSTSNNHKKIIEFEQNVFLKGLEFITPLYNAILYKRTLRIEYQSFRNGVLQNFTFSAYFLKQYNNRWFVFGKADGSSIIMNLALDRIASITESMTQYVENNEINFDEYFDDIIGVTKRIDMKVETIKLKINRDLLPYLKTKPLHGSQKLLTKEENESILSLEVVPNYELESLLLSFGEMIEVLSPIELRKQLIERIKKSLTAYESL